MASALPCQWTNTHVLRRMIAGPTQALRMLNLVICNGLHVGSGGAIKDDNPYGTTSAAPLQRL